VVAEYLGLLNLALAIFNLLPGFPLDGGRLLRATIWRMTGSLRTATRVASKVGRALGWALIGLGAYSLLVGGGLIGGLWMIFIGWFLTHAARASYQQLLLREILSPLTAGAVMSPHPEAVAPELSIDKLASDFFFRRPFGSFPVIDGGSIVGLVTLGQLRRLPREDWAGRSVSDLMLPREKTVIVQPETPMAEVLAKMREGGSGRVLVAREQELLGIISASDIARWLDRIGLVE
jgi:CBS domain-containing protein